MLQLTYHALRERLRLKERSRSRSSNPLLWLWGVTPRNTAFYCNLLFKDCSDCSGRKETWESLFCSSVHPDASYSSLKTSGKGVKFFLKFLRNNTWGLSLTPLQRSRKSSCQKGSVGMDPLAILHQP